MVRFALRVAEQPGADLVGVGERALATCIGRMPCLENGTASNSCSVYVVESGFEVRVQAGDFDQCHCRLSDSRLAVGVGGLAGCTNHTSLINSTVSSKR